MRPRCVQQPLLGRITATAAPSVSVQSPAASPSLEAAKQQGSADSVQRVLVHMHALELPVGQLWLSCCAESFYTRVKKHPNAVFAAAWS